MDEQQIGAGGAPVAVIGAGPVGLGAAAHLSERGIPFLVLEAGPRVATSMRAWGHVRLFSPWRYVVDAASRRLLEATGWQSPDEKALPTGTEFVRDYLEPLADLPQLAPSIRLETRVSAIGRLGIDRMRTPGRASAPFVVRLGSGEEIIASAVVDASGTWNTPNVLGADGLPAHGEREAAAWIDHTVPDLLGTVRETYARRHTVVVGAGHSAATTLLALAELAESTPGTRITWAIRSDDPARSFGGETDDQLPARGALGSGVRRLVGTGRVALATGFRTSAIRGLGSSPQSAGVELVSRDVEGRERVIHADRIVAATGFRPDHSLARELRLELDPVLSAPRALAPLIDPNEHSCGTVPPHGFEELSHPEPGYFVVGMKSYGRAPTFLLLTGYEQARSIVAALDGEWEAARRVQLELPESGVCSLPGVAGEIGACVTVPEPATAVAG